MLYEDLEDAALILRGILLQPLSLPDAKEEAISLFSAAQEFSIAQGSSSNLSKIMDSFLHYPGPTQTLIKELKIISSDLST
jgi:hypothetical protein